MATPAIQGDANFYNMVHPSDDSDPQNATAEQRGNQRRPFRSIQRIALFEGPGLPEESEFVEVQCHDLACNGFSFLLPSQPNFDSLVVSLGTPPSVIYVAAKVVHCRDVLVDTAGEMHYVEQQAGQPDRDDPPERTAAPMVLVGCRFTDRLSR